jgi:hypothetical protein
MNIVPTSRFRKFCVGAIAASAVSFPLCATAATLYVSDTGTGTIKQVSSTGTVTTFATGFSTPLGLAFDGSGNLFASDSNTIRQISSTGAVTTFATGLNQPAYLAFAPSAPSGSTAVPEPFTAIGTLIGGTAAVRMRKKLKSSGKV